MAATKRMFTKDVVRTDRFLDMPPSTRELYFQLNLDADVKGFVNPRGVMRLVGATDDDLNVLIGKGYVIPFETGVIVVTHWHSHNIIREDREAPSQYIDEANKLTSTTEGKYSLLESSGITPVKLPHRLDKIRVEKSREEKPKPAEALVFPEGEYGNILKEFVQYRKDMKKPMSPLAFNKLLKMLEPYSLEARVRMINKTIMNGWQGVFDKDENNAKKGGTYVVKTPNSNSADAS